MLPELCYFDSEWVCLSWLVDFYDRKGFLYLFLVIGGGGGGISHSD